MSLITRSLPLAILSILVLNTVVAEAAPIRWRYEGVVQQDFADLTAGSLIRMSWSFDSSEPNECHNGRGFYRNQAVTVAVGDRVWQATGYFHGAARFVDLCDDGPLISGNEVRLNVWTGPDLPAWMLVPLIAFVDNPPGFYFDRHPPTGTLPVTPPPFLDFEGPLFFNSESLALPLKTELSYVPEPSLVALLALVGVAAHVRARRR